MAASLFPGQRTLTLAVAFAAVSLSASADDPQSARSLAIEEVRIAAQAEVLAARCGLRLNTELEQELRSDAVKKLTPEAFSAMEEFARTYTLSLMRRHGKGICAHALEQFGLDWKQMEGLLLP